jgi:sulfur carrier protein
MSLTITLNGQLRTFADLQAPILDQLIAQLALKGDRVAVERNGQIVPRAEWSQTSVQDGDRLEVVHFVGGGAPSPLTPDSYRAGKYM